MIISYKSKLDKKKTFQRNLLKLKNIYVSIEFFSWDLPNVAKTSRAIKIITFVQKNATRRRVSVAY